MKIPNCQYVEFDTLEIVSRAEMLRRLESDYDFDEYTPISELWNYFDTLDNYNKMKAIYGDNY